MVYRSFWVNMVEHALKRRNIVWLAGVRRVGKTTLAQSLSSIEYFDCELPRTRRLLEEPEEFLDSVRGKRVVLDEVHRLSNPSELLKIAADHYPTVHIIAIGSSTLGASRKFRDSLTGRKETVWFTPMMSEDLKDFGVSELHNRLLHGGLPPYFLSDSFPEREFQEWIDAYWAKDIQELFQLERHHSFLKFTELLLSQSGGMFEATRFAKPCEVSRATISSYLKVLESTFIAYVIRPFSTYKPTEIVSAPKVYGFDTGFVCVSKGWESLRAEDYGLLWEHYVLNELHAHLQTRKINYWRNKQGQEIDFVIPPKGKRAPIGIECKWKDGQIDLSSLKTFLHYYPPSTIHVVCHDIQRPRSIHVHEKKIEIVGLDQLISRIQIA
jgi:uncharacterized protein